MRAARRWPTHNLALVEKALGNHDRAAQLMRDWIVSQREQGEWLRVAMGLSNLAYVYQAQGEWRLAQACLEQGLALCDAHDLALPRPAILANLAHNHAMSGKLDEAERVSRELVAEAHGKGLADVEATALNQLVRVAICAAIWPLARARLRDAVERAATLSIEYIRIDCVLSLREDPDRRAPRRRGGAAAASACSRDPTSSRSIGPMPKPACVLCRQSGATPRLSASRSTACCSALPAS